MAAMYEAEAKKGIWKEKKTSILPFVFSIGEIYELKAELNSDKRDRKKEAVKKVMILKISSRKVYFSCE